MMFEMDARFTLTQTPIGAYVMIGIFCALATRWILQLRDHAEGRIGERTPWRVLHEAFAASVLALSYMDRRWILDSSWEHPTDSLMLFGNHCPRGLRVWQQLCWQFSGYLS